MIVDFSEEKDSFYFTLIKASKILKERHFIALISFFCI